MRCFVRLAAGLALLAVLGAAGTAAAGESEAGQPSPAGSGSVSITNGWDMSSRGVRSDGGMGPWMTKWTDRSGHGVCAAMAEHVEARLAALKAELKITDAQMPLWAVYATAARDHSRAIVSHCTATMTLRDGSPVSLPDRLDQHEQFIAVQLDSLRAMNRALRPLYDALDENQKKTADQFLWMPLGVM